MATNSKIRHKLDLPESRPRDDGQEPNASSLDQVRDILFGQEIRGVEERLDEIQSQLREQLEDSRASVTGRVHAFEEFVKKRLDDLTSQIQTEREKRNTEIESFNASLRGALRDLQGQVVALDDTTVSKDAALRQHIASEIQSVTNRLEQLSKEMRMAMVDEAEAIRGEKMDTSKLVELFSDLTQRLSTDRPNSPSE